MAEKFRNRMKKVSFLCDFTMQPSKSIGIIIVLEKTGKRIDKSRKGVYNSEYTKHIGMIGIEDVQGGLQNMQGLWFGVAGGVARC